MNLRTMPIKTGAALAAELPAFQARERLLAGIKRAEVERHMRRRELASANRRLHRRLGEIRRRELAAITITPDPDAAENLARLEQSTKQRKEVR